MAINLELTRPKAVTTNTINSALSIGTVQETDTATEESFFIPVNLASINPPQFTVSDSTTTSGTSEVTTTNDGFADVKVGDSVTGSGIQSGTVVAAKANSNSITLDQNTTTTGSKTLSFNPPTVTPTIYALKLSHAKAGSSFGLNITLYTYDGSSEEVIGTMENASKTVNLISSDGQPVQVNMDSILTNLRVPQTA